MMQKVTPLARGVDKAMGVALLYIAAFVWMYTRVRSLHWAAALAVPLTALITIGARMLYKRVPFIRDGREEAERKEHALFKLLTGDADNALHTLAGAIFEAHGYTARRVENGVAFGTDGTDAPAIGVTQYAADTRALLEFHKRAAGARRAVLCSLEAPQAGVSALARRLDAPSILVYEPSDIMRYIRGFAPSDEQRARDARAKRAQGLWTAFRRGALRKDRAVRYMLYALALMVVYILTGWLWYPLPALACAAMGAASAHRAAAPRSPFD